MGTPIFRIIFHIDLNAFFASCETILRPELQNLPLAITGEKSSKRGIVVTANYVARQYGVHSAMPLMQAKKKCPHLVVASANFDLYRKISQQFIQLLHEYSDQVEKASIDEAYVDVTHLYQEIHPLHLAQQIQQRIFNELKIGCSIGVAPNKFLAKMASDMKKPNGITVLRKRDLPHILWPMPIEEMFGVGKASSPKLKQLGINTIGDLVHYKDVDKIEQLFGHHALKWIENAKGNDQNPINPNKYEVPSSIGHSTTFSKDYCFDEEIKAEAKRMCIKTSNRLKKYGLYAKTISIQLKDTSFKQITRSQTVQVPIQSVNELYPIIEELFDEHWEGQALRLIGVNTTNLVNTNKVTQQLNLFNYQSFASEEKLNQTIQQIKTKHGTHLIQKGIQKGQK
ncbi:DNA polymerase IV [Turicibacter bilis]|uniref:DNA polymerase IV n=1 Tax=Turicibacter TaxID=191303 RepID=UPI0006C27C76|nr:MULTISPECIES: DNA polymerase IV [Turicibacter]MBP3907889.1 DNA polymerase IV [Turicibacter sp.]CUN67738.1 DNA polymerase IV [Turicibacter sanguinis]AMC09481.1 DNA polymerase IV [Turicibacter sp. H121]MBS3203009.1 DNA polymerase IV [Turicibacter bilis]MCU7199471.1 DNA polymerase IV [Turicibacter sp. H121]